MNAALLLAGLAMGLAASPHCAAMCSAPCAALSGGCRRDAAGFQAGRLAGYMAAGAAAAASVQALGVWSQAAPALRPLWLLLQLGFLALGAWWLVTGRAPPWMAGQAALPVIGWHGMKRSRRSMRALLGGLAWVAWPCGVLQGALLLAALAGGALGGAAVMAAFAIGSMPALMLAPWAWSRWQASRKGTAGSIQVAALGYRIGGAGLILATGWALTHGLWQRLAAWCLG